MWFKKTKNKITTEILKEVSLEEYIQEKEQIIRSIIKDMLERKNWYAQKYLEFYNLPTTLDLNIPIFELLETLHLHPNGLEKNKYDNKIFYDCNIRGETEKIFYGKSIVVSILFIRDKIELNTCRPGSREGRGYITTYVEQEGKLKKIREGEWVS